MSPNELHKRLYKAIYKRYFGEEVQDFSLQLDNGRAYTAYLVGHCIPSIATTPLLLID